MTTSCDYKNYKQQEFEKSVVEMLASIKVVMPSIILIGPSGAGKTSVGEEIARHYGVQHIDTDSVIESCSDLRIPTIFSEYGESYFRTQEKYLLNVLVDKAVADDQTSSWNSHHPATIRSVISTGGGTPTIPENFEKLSQLGLIIALTASVDVLLDRLHNTQNRPLLQVGTDDVKEKRMVLEVLLKERKSIYERANSTIDTTLLSVKDVAALVSERIINDHILLTLKK